MERRLLPIAAGLVLAGCTTFATAPSVMVLPGTGRSVEQFQADDALCRQWTLQQTGASPGTASTESTTNGAAIGTAVPAGDGAGGRPSVQRQRSYDMAYMQCMYAKGNQIPVHARFAASTGTEAPDPGQTPPIEIPPPPPGSPPPPPGA